jgi:uncharacterized protein DUF6986
MIDALTNRQPVHTVYGGAHLFSADIARKLGAGALKALHDHAPNAEALAYALELTPELGARIYPRLVDKLTREPVEDFRIDFEDGFGHRSDEEEDRYARLAAEQMAVGLAAGTLPPTIGIRIKPLSKDLKRRSFRTLDIFLSRALGAGPSASRKKAGKLPPGFVITLPKITAPAQVSQLASKCRALERAHGLAAGALAIEVMVETTESIFAADGTIALPRLVSEGRGRVIGAHFGTYDYTAALGITAGDQHMLNPVCDFARHVMQVALAGTGIRLSDGATNVMPVGATDAVHRAWRLQMRHIRHSLATGFYQGWDLHPAQLPARYAAVFAFFLEGLGAASERLRQFVAKAAQATLVGDVFDDAATGQGLLNYFLRAMSCGAITEAEAVELSGLTAHQLRSRSFIRILESCATPVVRSPRSTHTADR